ncbi:MAG: glycosyltransferase family 2 protein [Bryobacterales bacterium]|nr:glycosyltransferase family 2 protein [Bryobacterales bacterium]
MNLASLLFLAGALFILYTLVGYPLLLTALARRARVPIERRWEPRTVSILLPIRNGEGWVRNKLQSIRALNYPRELLEILVASDGSTDSTEATVREFEIEGVRLFSLPPGGKAVALNLLMEHASGEILFFTDVRQTLDPDSLRLLVACFADLTVGVASGELVILDQQGREDTEVGLYWQYEKWMRKRLSSIDSLPGATGCIYAMRRELAVPLPPDCLLDDVYLPMAAFFRGRRLILEDMAKAYDSSSPLGTEFRRKVRTQAGIYQILFAFPDLLGPRNRMWIHFVSHKFARLLLPFALALIAVSSFWLPEPWGRLALSGQALFYGLAFLDIWLPPGFPLRRLTSPIRTFVTLHGRNVVRQFHPIPAPETFLALSHRHRSRQPGPSGPKLESRRFMK